MPESFFFFTRLQDLPLMFSVSNFSTSMTSEMSSVSSRSSHHGSKEVTFKPWFLTCVESDVFGWKDGARLKLKDGQLAGHIGAISVLTSEDKTVTVRF